MYQNFVRVIENANVIISTYEAEDMGESQQVTPTNGTVAFGSALFGWAFTLTKFANTYASKFNLDRDKMMLRLWGDNFFDAKNKKWSKEEYTPEGEKLKRAFAQFIMEPIMRLTRNIFDNNKEAVMKMLKHLDISLKTEEQEKVGKDLFKCVF